MAGEHVIVFYLWRRTDLPSSSTAESKRRDADVAGIHSGVGDVAYQGSYVVHVACHEASLEPCHSSDPHFLGVASVRHEIVLFDTEHGLFP